MLLGRRNRKMHELPTCGGRERDPCQGDGSGFGEMQRAAKVDHCLPQAALRWPAGCRVPSSSTAPREFMMFSIPASQKYWKTNVFRILEWKSTLNKAFGVFFQMPFSFLAIWKNGNRIWKNTPNALFEVLSNFKMRKVLFKCFWDVGI